MAEISIFFIECVSNGIFAQNFSKLSNFGFSWKKKWGFSDEKAWIFCQKWLVWQIWCTICLKLCFCSGIFKMFKNLLFSEKTLEFFQKRKISKKLWNASQIVIMLKNSQKGPKFGFFGNKEIFFRRKILIFSKLANWGKFFIECILNCTMAQEFSKRSKLFVFFLQKR